MTERIEFIAKTVDEAVMNAMKHFGTTRDKINVRIVEEGSKGLFGFGAKDAKIVASLKDLSEIKPEKKEEPKLAPKKEAPKKETKKETAPAPANDDETESVPKPRKERVLTDEAAAHGEKASVEFLSGLIEKMGIDCTATAQREGECVKVVLRGEGVGMLIGRRGDTLDSVQYLTNLYVNKKRRGDDYCRIIVDSETYRAKRQETLIRLANSMANKACKYHKDMSLEPMTPYERRIIHSALQNVPNVKTRSVGEEPNRRVIVMYKK